MKKGNLGEHFRLESRLKMVPKKSFESKDDADYFILSNNDRSASSYLCSICNKWHIGHIKHKNE